MSHRKAKKQRQPKVSYEEMVVVFEEAWRKQREWDKWFWGNAHKMMEEYLKQKWTAEGWYDED